ncbi:MAG: DDE-type integrase/transposase/recombinase [Planctomycetes bacterium]|nr:DDE-type integrase/transposase/recombinase [Planctomycetota bacterium]
MTVAALLLENSRLRNANALLRARLDAIPAPHRPRYTPWQRHRILAFQTMHGLGVEETARSFAVTVTTVRRWWKDAREGAEVLVRAPGRPATRKRLIEELTRMLRLALTWSAGTRTLAGHLYRLGLKTSRSTVQRILKEKPRPPDTPGVLDRLVRKIRRINAKYFGHTVILDFTRAPRAAGDGDLWIGGALDIFSRTLLATRTCAGQPTAKFATRLLDDAKATIGRAPKHSISDQGVQFKSKRFKKHLKRLGIKHRFGALGEHGSIAFLERAWRTLKESIPWTWCIFGTAESLNRHVADVRRWYNGERPHTSLRGAAPDDIRRGRRRRTRTVPATGKWKLTVRWTGATRDLPVVRLRKVA